VAREDTSTQAFITPSIILWARDRAHMTREGLAAKINTKPSNVQNWETGESLPTLAQADRLAKALYIPFGYLFLKSPPREEVPLPDFRTIKSAEFAKPSAEFLDLLHDVVVKHDWYREFLQQEGRLRLPFVGSFTISAGPATVANSISTTLKIDSQTRNDCGNWEDFLRAIIRKAEESGIVVMRSGIVAGNQNRRVSPNEFRGFSICDSLAPLIYINASDWKAAQIFTVAHELAHIWIGKSGISNEDMRIKESDNQVERFCNATAAEVLVPKVDFVQRWVQARSVDANVAHLTRYFKVSSLVILRRAYNAGYLSWSDYESNYRNNEELFRRKELEQRESSGGNYYANLFARNSPTFTNSVVAAVIEGKTLYREAAHLLNVKVDTISKLAERLSFASE
jgi:Zn-dependent peptidase ImmA (M78 family)/transcriptional regulator with XRE-family HTH domain